MRARGCRVSLVLPPLSLVRQHCSFGRRLPPGSLFERWRLLASPLANCFTPRELNFFEARTLLSDGLPPAPAPNPEADAAASAAYHLVLAKQHAAARETVRRQELEDRRENTRKAAGEQRQRAAPQKEQRQEEQRQKREEQPTPLPTSATMWTWPSSEMLGEPS